MPAKIRKKLTPQQKRRQAIRRYESTGQGDDYVFCPECEWPVLPLDNGAIRRHTTAEGKPCPMHGVKPDVALEIDIEDEVVNQPSIADQSWRERAACVDRYPLFDRATGPTTSKALAICNTCPVTADCYQWAKIEANFIGVAGGVIWYRDRSITDETVANA